MKREMRRKDRLITSMEELKEITGEAEICRIAMVDSERTPYIVPLNFGYEWKGEELILYFHSAKEGRKIDILRSNPNVCFELECRVQTAISSEEAERSTCYYMSLIGDGKARFILENDEKLYAIQRIMEKYTGIPDMEIGQTALNSTLFFCVTSTQYSGKKNAAPV